MLFTNSRNNAAWLAGCLAVLLVCQTNAQAEKAPLSKRELEETATHIVVGRVQAIYSRSEQRGNYEYTHRIAEVKVDDTEKGEAAGKLIHVRYLSIRWKGAGLMPPGPSGHFPRPQVGEKFRIYLARDAYDGFSKNNDDGGFNVIYGNGFEPLD